MEAQTLPFQQPERGTQAEQEPGRQGDWLLPRGLQTLHAGPFADAAPPFDAIMPRDLGARRHGAKLSQRQLERLSHETPDLELPIGKSVRGKRPVAVIVDLGRAVRLEVLRDLGLAIFAGKRLGRDERPLARIGERLRLVEDALDPRLLGKLAVAAAGERSAGDGKSAREEAAPVELWA